MKLWAPSRKSAKAAAPLGYELMASALPEPASDRPAGTTAGVHDGVEAFASRTTETPFNGSGKEESAFKPFLILPERSCSERTGAMPALVRPEKNAHLWVLGSFGAPPVGGLLKV